MEKNPFKRTVLQCVRYIRSEFSDAQVIEAGNTDAIVNNISYNSSTTEKNDVFICKGKGFKKAYLEEALEKGAVCVIVPCEINTEDVTEKYSAVFIKSKYPRWILAELSAFFYDFPMSKLATVAVTGTKGKSGTVEMIKNVLNGKNGIRAATLKECLDGAASLTTPESAELHRAAYNALKNGKTHLVCEVSSQAVKHLRICGVTFDIGCFLNFSLDHISPSEHLCAEEYFLCKSEMLLSCKRVVLNKNIECREIIRGICEKNSIPVTVFSADSDGADVYAKEISSSEGGYSFSVEKNDIFQGKVYLPFFGNYNIENALCAYTVGNIFEISFRDIFRALASSFVLGRGEVMSSSDGNIHLIVDYAHNGLSFRKVFEEAERRFPSSKITAVFGCPGDKAVVRRYQLPYESLKHADRIIICEDDSGKEGFDRIVSDVFSNVDEILKDCECNERIERLAAISVCKNRAKAIENAVETAFENRERRVILILGRGSDTVMKTESGAIGYISDIELAKKAIDRIDREVSIANLVSGLKGIKKQRMLVSVAPDPFMIKNLAASLSALSNDQIHIAICCKWRYTELLREHLFKSGVHSHICRLESEYQNECGYCFRAGVIPIIAYKGSEREVTSVLLKSVYFENVVYMTEKKGILIDGKAYVPTLGYENAVLLQENTSTKGLSLLTEAIESGVSEAALLDGNAENALAFYLCGGRIHGTSVRKTI